MTRHGCEDNLPAHRPDHRRATAEAACARDAPFAVYGNVPYTVEEVVMPVSNATGSAASERLGARV